MHQRKKGRESQKRKRRREKGWKRVEIQPLQINAEEILKREEEDILKFLFENKEKKINFPKLDKFTKKFNIFLNEGLKRLLKEKLIVLQNGYYSLTPAGEDIGGKVLKKHMEIEYFIKSQTNKCDAHQMAHILEHSLTENAIQGMFTVSSLKEQGIPLSQFKLPSGTIVDISWNSCNLMTKLISIGIFPGQRIQILSKSVNNYLLEVKRSKIAIDRILAKVIKLIP